MDQRRDATDVGGMSDASNMPSNGKTTVLLAPMQIRIKPSRVRKATKPRTCCDTHTDGCKFGREHQWSIGWIGGPKSGVGIGEPGWHDSTICVECKGVCTADMEEGGRA